MLVYQKESYAVTGAAIEVHKQLGCGFLEKVYQEALSIELERRGIPYEREKRITVIYKGKPLQQEYIADFVCYDKIIVELKATSEIENSHRAQVINYLKATGFELGILYNFGEESLHYERLLNIKNRNENNIGKQLS